MSDTELAKKVSDICHRHYARGADGYILDDSPGVLEIVELVKQVRETARAEMVEECEMSASRKQLFSPFIYLSEQDLAYRLACRDVQEAIRSLTPTPSPKEPS